MADEQAQVVKNFDAIYAATKIQVRKETINEGGLINILIKKEVQKALAGQWKF